MRRMRACACTRKTGLQEKANVALKSRPTAACTRRASRRLRTSALLSFGLKACPPATALPAGADSAPAHMRSLFILVVLGTDLAAAASPRQLEEELPPACSKGSMGCPDNPSGKEQGDTDGVCKYLAVEDGIKMDNPDCNGKCSVAGTAKSEYDCLNAADGEQCCEWDDNSPNNAQRQDTAGVCHYLEFEDGIKMDDPTCNGKCSVAGTAKTEYDCNHADGGVCT